MKNPSIAFALVVGSLVGCGEMPDAADDEGVTQEISALPTTFKLHNYQTGYCLGVAAGTPTYGTALVPWTCDGSTNQTWSAVQKTQGDTTAYLMKNYVADSRCMQVPNYNNGAPGQIQPCTTLGGGSPGSPLTVEAQGWHLNPAGTDNAAHACYRLERPGTTRVLGVSNGSGSPGTATILWDNFNDIYKHPDQLWCVY
jgi:Ricin-type beta-trefoil lectin domain